MADDEQFRDEFEAHPGQGEGDPHAQEQDEDLEDMLEDSDEPAGRARWATPARLWAGLAGAFLLGALVATLVVALLGGPAGDSGDSIARTELVGMDSAVEDAEAELLESEERRTLLVRAGELPDVADGYAQVWLTTRDGSRVVPLGVLEQGETELTLPSTVDLGAYQMVEVSLETFDDDPGHSGRTLWRGQLDTPAS